MTQEQRNVEMLLRKVRELEKALLESEEKNDFYKSIIDDEKLDEADRKYKDRLFKFIFGNPDCKQWTLSLYNAINGSSYTNPEEIQFNTLRNVVYMRMRNDVSFLVASEMNLWEHQSTFNPNMPMRFLIYAGKLYDKYTYESDYNKYSSSLQPMPTPRCICFYNGKGEQPERTVLKLSQAYGGEGDIEVIVTMLNVNFGKNQELMDACEPLKEYAWFVDEARIRQSQLGSLDSAVSFVIDKMPEQFLLKPFLVAHKAEVIGMFLEEYDEAKHMRLEREEGRNERTIEMVTNLLKLGGVTITYISKVSGLYEDEIIKLATKLGVKTQDDTLPEADRLLTSTAYKFGSLSLNLERKYEPSGFLEVYDEEKHMRLEREEGRNERTIEMVTNLLKLGVPISVLSKASNLSEDEINNVATTLGIKIRDGMPVKPDTGE